MYIEEDKTTLPKMSFGKDAPEEVDSLPGYFVWDWVINPLIVLGQCVGYMFGIGDEKLWDLRGKSNREIDQNHINFLKTQARQGLPIENRERAKQILKELGIE